MLTKVSGALLLLLSTAAAGAQGYHRGYADPYGYTRYWSPYGNNYYRGVDYSRGLPHTCYQAGCAYGPARRYSYTYGGGYRPYVRPQYHYNFGPVNPYLGGRSGRPGYNRWNNPEEF